MPGFAALTGTGLVADDLYLMVPHEATGRPCLHPRALSPGLAGALLAELVLSGNARIDRSQVVVTVQTPPGDGLTRSILRELLKQGRSHLTKTGLPCWRKTSFSTMAVHARRRPSQQPLLRVRSMTFVPPNGGTGTVRVAVRRGMRRAAESSTPVPVPSSPSAEQALLDRLQQPYLEMTAWSGAVPRARHHARQLLWDLGLKQFIEPVELLVSELVTNAARACGGLDANGRGAGYVRAVVRLWLSVEADSVLVLVWDASPAKPQRQELQPDANNGRGLYLVEMLSAAWGCFEIADQPGKVVWALCRG